ncbi:2-phospho-L-lactate guanylyltransferase [Streptomyces spiramenti]|uniref:Phosphoenolpyruvate guanylyltransferase n=1 Tax=Streptomyces spiramenti TaxID=2720606 RepID=A0ABX1AD80_9ACTN|nr:2-phospho-L-lactate guanylyltransferase [Streptomyces spiramenti]NJP65138.1 2-phospho-L-lactate guanylyltransferase [Streptomyces spiramenti]
MTGGWAVVMPVKRLGGAKTRLADTTGEELRPALALAFAEDTLAAVLECPAVSSVTVVTDDEVVGAALSRLGAGVVPDSPRGGLNAAVEHGVGAVRVDRPGAPVAALNADLPALRAAELGRVLDEAEVAPRSFLADAAGTGTTLLAVLPGVEPAPGFGPASRMRHRASGAVELMPADVESVRQDVDTGEDLLVAIALGVGPRTARSTHRLGTGFRRSAASHS